MVFSLTIKCIYTYNELYLFEQSNKERKKKKSRSLLTLKNSRWMKKQKFKVEIMRKKLILYYYLSHTLHYYSI